MWTGEVRLSEAALHQALKWKRGRRIFWNAHGDLFHENVPDEAIDRLFAVCALTPQHTHIILTKRSARMRAWFASDHHYKPPVGAIADLYCTYPEIARRTPFTANLAMTVGMAGWPLPNVWLGVSVEDQARADERIPDLLATPAGVRFLSCEPLIGPIELPPFGSLYIDWVIAGGESGPGARPMHPDWPRALRDQCAAAGVPFFFKQLGEWAPGNGFGLNQDRPISDKRGNVRDWMSRYVTARKGYADERGDRLRAHTFTGHATDLVYRVGKARAGRLLDNRTWDEVPE